MPNTLDRQTARYRMGAELRMLVGEMDTGISADFTQAMRSFLTAMDYEDDALMRSHLNAALHSLVEVTNGAVRRRLGWPQRIELSCRRLSELAEQAEQPGEFDEQGREIVSRFDRMIASLTDLRDGTVKLLLDHGYEIEAVSRLEEDIEALIQLKEATLNNWPWSDAQRTPDLSVSCTNLASKLDSLASEWKAARGHTASVNMWVRLPAYQQIIEIGRLHKDEVIGFLLKELTHSPDHWFWALKELTGQNPVTPESRGNIDSMSKCWIEWGKQHGYR